MGADLDKDRAADFCFPASWCTAAAANEWKMEENGSFVHGFLIWRARLATAPLCADWRMLSFDGHIDFFVLWSSSGERRPQSTKQANVCSYFNQYPVFICALKVLAFKSGRDCLLSSASNNKTLNVSVAVRIVWMQHFRPHLLSLFPHTRRWGGASFRLMQVKSPGEPPTQTTGLPVSRLQTWIWKETTCTKFTSGEIKAI